MRRILVVVLGLGLFATAVWVVRRTTPGSNPRAAAAAPASARAAHHPEAATTGDAARRAALVEAANMFPVTASGDSRTLARQLARARLATARYATDLRAAKAAGYQLITRMIPDMGWHFLNPTIHGFDVTKPAILVYQRRGRHWQLAALEWVFLQQPQAPPLPGASYGSFGAACHYQDGTLVVAGAKDDCTSRSPATGAAFTFWHPNLVTLHVWVWYHNPDGLYHGTNPLVRPFNRT